jgi:subtilase family serine protease
MRIVKSLLTAILPALLPALLIASSLPSLSYAATPDRISGVIDSSQKIVLKGNVHGFALPKFDLGRADGSRLIHGVSLAFHPSAAQQKDLDLLLTQLQDRSSSNYHKWLTPAQFADRFGMSRNDVKRIIAWLQSEGFANISVSNSRNQISFDGTVAQIELVFGTEMRNYLVKGEVHLANATNPSVPAALAGAVLAVVGLHDFSPKPRAQVRPNLTSYVSGNHFLSPADFATIYDLNALYSAGATGSNQKIAVIGQSTIIATDINNFRSAAGLPASTVTMTLAGGTGAQCSGDEGESDLDVEWSGGVAKDAQIIFVFAGLVGTDTCSNRSNNVWNALDYAVQNNVAPIISTSYGFCESGLGSAFATSLQTTVQQANTQGQTLVAASGDSGAADCDPSSSTSATGGLAVDIPAAIPEVTGMGGTEFSADAPNCTTACPPGANPPYWAAAGATTDTLSSALEYIPETAWNDTTFNIANGGGFGASGGGASLGSALGFFAKPVWQTGTGVPADGKRDVPDLALSASADHDGYLFCSEDAGAGTCSSGFRTGAGGTFTIVGGTSVAAPTFSAILALVNQYLGNTPPNGLGNINLTLYQLPGNNPEPFHDVTTGDNKVPCTSGTTNCPAGTTQIGFSAGIGYDQVTGLGSVDGFALAQILARTPTTTAVSTSSGTVNLGASVTFTATVTPATATGTVNFFNNGSTTALGSGNISGGTATFTTTSLPLGSNSVTASYSGDTSDRISTSATPAVTSVTTSFSLTSSLGTGGTLSVAQGSTSGAVTLTVTSSTGFIVTSGTSSSTALPLTYSCSGLPSESSCLFSPAGTSSATSVSFTIKTTPPTVAQHTPDGGIRIFYAALLPGLFGIMFTMGSRQRSLRGFRLLGLIVVLGFSSLWLASCSGGGSGGNKDPGTPKGTSTVTVNSTTGGAAAISSSLTFQLTVN